MGDVKIPNWLKGLPLAPEFYPTHTEFADPIAYISKIEKEASEFGICKIIPPLPKPSKKYVFSNLNKSLAKRPELGEDVKLGSECSPVKIGIGDGSDDGEVRAVFTTRHQELGQTVKRAKGAGAAAIQNAPSGVDKQVWQSGEVYTLEQFETKAKVFARSILGTVKEVCPLIIEAMFWKAASEKPIYVEYANDVPGSAFEEPEGQLRYFHRRRRKRNSYQRSGANSDCKKGEMISSCGMKSQNSEVKDASPNNVSNTCLEVSKSPASPKTVSTDDTSQHSRRKNLSSSCEIEGSAGWNLSNSPWNLQVIARAPGSLTRFMPDDIPGVTSPMIYIGMLFSWFAWHVEDHELHSMNFLHNGSSKTWYAVPGDYAFGFEELVRTEAYGGTADRLDALSLLGNKTTLMSPEVVIASGIPCCRLIQSPGEFVVTFPRSYHVGFSHGFNCGEAANFGTPQWLKVAKDAAVRRAAMNYLPMLSHQQLLYLSTMSFVSRVPKSLLPGVRSSRMRDRQKEDRELSVKKAFIEDILNENDVLSALLGKDSDYRAVLWNPDLLPYASKDSPILSASAPADVNSKENASNTQFGNSSNDRNFFDEMSLYMENMNDLYLGSDDLSSDFQVDSGTLACVACGILGFPFMCVVQPSEKASIELQHEESPGVSDLKNSSLSSEHHKSLKGYTTEDLPLMSNAFTPANDPLIPCATKFNKHWNTDSNFLRPRSFCLEHAVETSELLQCKGGANMLVICHSDYQKIKAPAASIAEEIGFPFNYNEVSLDNALKEDLNLIDLAVDHGRDECGEDWTSKLGINLRYCVKVRKTSSSKRVQHALALGGFFSKQSSISEFQTVNWQSRRSRSKKVYLDAPYKEGSDSKKIDAPYKQGGISDKEKEVMAAMSADATSIKRRKKIIQYSRRNKPKASISLGVGTVVRHSEGLDEYSRRATSNGKSTGNCARFDSTQSNSISEIHHVAQMLEATSDTSLNLPPSEVTDSLALITGTVDTRMENQSLEENSRNGNGCKLSSQESDMQDETEIPEEAQENKSVTPLVLEGNERFGKKGEVQITEELNKRQSQVLADEDIGMVGFSNFTKSTNLFAGSSIVTTSEELMVNEVNEVIEKSFVDRSIEGEHMSTSVTLGELTHPCISVEESSNIPRGSSSEEGMGNGVSSDTVVQQGVQTTNEFTEAPRPSFVARIENQPILTSVEERVPRVTYATDGFTGSVTLDKKGGRTNRDSDEGLVASHDTSKCDLSRVQIKTYSRVKRGAHATQNFPNGSEDCTSKRDGVLDNIEFSIVDSRPSPKHRNKRKGGGEELMDDNINFNGFVRGPCEGLRPRSGKDATRRSSLEIDSEVEEKPIAKKVKKPSDVLIPKDKRKEPPRKSHRCNIGNCRMSFQTKEQLMVHKCNRCPHEECGKKFRSHKYARVHSRVHDNNRPFKCSWKGCSMSFKWEWSRTEHTRVHTGEKPYKCQVDDCGLSFRFISDLSRHRRKMEHYVN